jgi:hypothetical protein
LHIRLGREKKSCMHTNSLSLQASAISLFLDIFQLNLCIDSHAAAVPYFIQETIGVQILVHLPTGIKVLRDNSVIPTHEIFKATI